MARTNTTTGGGGGGNIASINGDSTPAQIFLAGTGISITPGPAGTNTITNTAPGGGSIIPITEVALLALQAGSLLDPTVVYYVTDAGGNSGQLSAPYAQIYVTAFSTTQLNPECNGQFQNSMMSTPVLFSGQYTFAVIATFPQFVFTQVITTKQNNKWSANLTAPNIATALYSLDTIPFDSVTCYDNVFENVSLLTFDASTVYTASILKNMVIEFNSHTGTIFEHHTQQGQYGDGLSYGNDIILKGDDCYFKYNNLNFCQVDQMGDNCGIVGTYVQDGHFGGFLFNNQNNCYLDFCSFRYNGLLLFNGDGSYMSNCEIGNDFFGVAIDGTVDSCTFDNFVQFSMVGESISFSHFGEQANYTGTGVLSNVTDLVMGSNSIVDGNGVINRLTVGQGATVQQNLDINSVTVAPLASIINNGNITISSFDVNCTVENNGDIDDCHFGPDCNVQTTQGLNRNTFGAAANIGTMGGSIFDCEFGVRSGAHDVGGTMSGCQLKKQSSVHDILGNVARCRLGSNATISFLDSCSDMVLESLAIVSGDVTTTAGMTHCTLEQNSFVNMIGCTSVVIGTSKFATNSALDYSNSSGDYSDNTIDQDVIFDASNGVAEILHNHLGETVFVDISNNTGVGFDENVFMPGSSYQQHSIPFNGLFADNVIYPFVILRIDVGFGDAHQGCTFGLTGQTVIILSGLSHTNETMLPGANNFTAVLDISNLTTIDLTDVSYSGMIFLDSTNSSETIDSITNPLITSLTFLSLFPYTLTPVPTKTINYTVTPVASAVAGDIVSDAGNFTTFGAAVAGHNVSDSVTFDSIGNGFIRKINSVLLS